MDTTAYTDYPKYNQISDLIEHNEEEIKDAHDNNPQIEGKDGIIPLSDHLQELRREIKRTQGAIDTINQILERYGSYIDHLEIESLDDLDEPGSIMGSMLATIYINPFKLKDKTLQEISDLMHQVNSEYITTVSNISLPLPTDKKDLNYTAPSHYLNISVFIDDLSNWLNDNELD